jgi:glycosyltransferase involved in cell wall biosynthesis
LSLSLISIVTPSFNQAAFLEQTIRSVLDQAYPRLEYLIMDAGSTDGSVEIIRKYEGRLAYWQSEKDNGPASALNAGFRRSTGGILAYLNSDDCYLPGALEMAAETFARHPEVDVIYSDIDFIDAEGRPTTFPNKHVKRFKAIPFNLRFMASGCLVIPQQGSFWRRRVFEKVGGFVESNWTNWDYEFFVDAALAGFKFLHVPRVLAQFRIHNASVSGSNKWEDNRRTSRERTAAKWRNAGFQGGRAERLRCRVGSGVLRAIRYLSA